MVFRLRHVIIGFLKKGEIILIAALNKIGPASLAITAQLICSQGKWRLTQDHVPFNDMFFQQFFHYKCLITFDTQRLILDHWDSSTCNFLNFIFTIFNTLFLKFLSCHLVAHQHLPWAHYSLQWLFHKSLSYCQLLLRVFSQYFLIFHILLYD